MVKKCQRVYSFHLAYHLKTIIGIQISRKIPSKTPVLLPQLKALLVLLKQALDLKVMDSAQLNNTLQFEANAHNVSN